MKTSGRRTDVDEALARSRLTRAKYGRADNELSETIRQREVRNGQFLDVVRSERKQLGKQLRRVELQIALRKLFIELRATLSRLAEFVRTRAGRLLLLSLVVLIGWLLVKWLFQIA